MQIFHAVQSKILKTMDTPLKVIRLSNTFLKLEQDLDSQILGDFEIIAQLNNSFLRSKKLGAIDPSFDRLLTW